MKDRKNKLFDSHAHYDDKTFAKDLDHLMNYISDETEVSRIVNAACNLESCKTTIALSEKYPLIWPAVGIHPSDAHEGTPEGLDELKKYISHPNVVAVGETGLDYHYDGHDKHQQQETFAAQLEIAAEAKLPVIIHQRDALIDTLDILRSFKGRVTGVVHCFSESVETARTILNMGHYVSFTGIITYPNARRAVESAAYAPSDRIMIETDCPYLTPVPHRFKRNSSAYLNFTCEKLAEARGISFEEAAALTYENGIKFFASKNR